MRYAGCAIRWKAKKRLPCKECGKPTSSEPGLCREHATIPSILFLRLTTNLFLSTVYCYEAFAIGCAFIIGKMYGLKDCK